MLLGLPKTDGDVYEVRDVIPIEDDKFFLGDADHRFKGIFLSGELDLDEVVFAKSATGIAAFNTVDQVTNYEKFVSSWNTNVYEQLVKKGGTGTLRKLRYGVTDGTAFSEVEIQNGTGPQYLYKQSVSALAGPAVLFGDGTVTNAALNASAIVQTFVGIEPYVNQTSTAGYTALLVNPTENAVGSGTRLLLDLQIGGTSKLRYNAVRGFSVATASLRVGTATLSSGTVTVTNASVTSATRFFFTGVGTTNAGTLTLGTVTDNTSFIITSSNVSDARVVHYWMVEAY